MLPSSNHSSALASGIYALLDVDRLGCSAGGTAELERLLWYALAAERGGAIALQLRFKSAPLGDSLRALMAKTLVRALPKHLALVVDDDVAAAAAAGCGVHLGQTDAPVGEARLALGPAALIGWSTHSLDQVHSAQRIYANYLGFGPIRPTASKERADAVTGWAQLSDACRASALPIVAIGGLQSEDAVTAKACGAAAMAVIGAWLGPVDDPWPPERAAVELVELARQWAAAPGAGGAA